MEGEIYYGKISVAIKMRKKTKIAFLELSDSILCNLPEILSLGR